MHVMAPPAQNHRNSDQDDPQSLPSSQLCARIGHECEDPLRMWFVKALILSGTLVIFVVILLWFQLFCHAVMQSYPDTSPVNHMAAMHAIQGRHGLWETMKDHVRTCFGCCPRQGDDASNLLSMDEQQHTSPFDNYFPRPGTPIPGSPTRGDHSSLLSSMHHSFSNRVTTNGALAPDCAPPLHARGAPHQACQTAPSPTAKSALSRTQEREGERPVEPA